jgi:hypothetical protein
MRRLKMIFWRGPCLGLILALLINPFNAQAASSNNPPELTAPWLETGPQVIASATDSLPPEVIFSSPGDDETDVALNRAIVATFSENLKAATVNSSNCQLLCNDVSISCQVSYDSLHQAVLIKPQSQLSAEAVYSVVFTTALTDETGNPLSDEYSWSFYTGTETDSEPPLIVSQDPDTDASGVALNSQISVEFSETLNPLSVTSTTFVLRYASSGIKVEGTVDLLDNLAVFEPSADLAEGTLYSVTLTRGVSDLAGNTLSADYSWHFTTGADSDNEAPEVYFNYPESGATGVATDTPIYAYFSENMAPLSVNSTTVYLRNESSQALVSGELSLTDNVLNFIAAANLKAQTPYRLTITRGVTDLVGNPLAQDYSWSFTTGPQSDFLAPEVYTTIPDKDATGVATDILISADFSEDLDPASVNAETVWLRRVNPDGAVGGGVALQYNTIFFHPASELSAGVQYRLTISSGVSDLAGNHLAENYSWSFTTGSNGDYISPEVSATLPVDSASGVALDSPISATFSEPLAAASVTKQTVLLRNDATETLVSGEVSLASNQITFQPSAKLAEKTCYTTIISMGVSDPAGNYLNTAYCWSFTTGSGPDLVPPQIVSYYPAKNAISVPRNTHISTTFSEALDPASVNAQSLALYKGSTAVAATLKVSGSIVTLDPLATLASNTQYTVKISNALRDLSNNYLTSNFSWSFTTGAGSDTSAPGVTGSSPPNGATGVALASVMTVQLSESPDPATVNGSTVLLHNDDIDEYLSGQVTLAGHQISFQPLSRLDENIQYTMTISSALADLAGNFLSGGYSWTFVTVAESSLVPPEVIFTNPLNGQSGVAFNTTILVNFSQPLDPAGVDNLSVVLLLGNTAVPGAVGLAGTNLFFQPQSNLVPNQVYCAWVSARLKNLDGSHLSQIYSWSFRTGAESDNEAPLILSVDPPDGQTGVPLDSELTIDCNETMAPGSVNSQTVFLHNLASGGLVSGQIELFDSTIIFKPTSDLGGSTLYNMTITSAVTDLAGNGLKYSYTWGFSTLPEPDNIAPVVTSCEPSDGATGVDLDVSLQLTFSEAMDPATVTAENFSLLNNDLAEAVGGALEYDAASHRATFQPASQLAGDSAYTATLSSAASDLAGNALASDFVWSFKTRPAKDITPPVVIDSSPAPGETGVGVNIVILAAFSEDLRVETLTVDNFTLKKGAQPVKGTLTYSDHIASLTPQSGLEYETTYTATLSSGVTDLAGNHLSQDFSWSFTTVESPYPYPWITSTSPSALATDVPINSEISVVFSAAMDPATVDNRSFTLSHEAWPVAGKVELLNHRAVFTPAANLQEYSLYTARVSTAVRDLEGQSISDNYSWSFTTGSADITPPQIVSSTPMDGAIGVSPLTGISVSFSEAMDPATLTSGTFSLRNDDLEAAVSGEVTYHAVIATAVFQPAAALLFGTHYSATLSSSVTDLAGNHLGVDYSWSFVTEAEIVPLPPAVIATSPGQGDRQVALDSAVKARFSQNLDPATITLESFNLMENGSPLDGLVSWDESTQTATFWPPDNLTADRLYNAEITTAVANLEGIHLAEAYQWSFRTIENALPAPAVVAISPADNATNISLNPIIQATFSVAMDNSTFSSDNFTLKLRGTTPVSGRITYYGDNQTAVFKPAVKLASGATYSMTVSSAVRDITGRQMADNFTWSFKTVKAVISGGGSGSSSPSNRALALNGWSSTAPPQINSQGVVQNAALLKTSDGRVSLEIARGTQIVSAANLALNGLSAAVWTAPPPAPDGQIIILAYTFGPAGAQFSPALRLSLNYDAGTLPPGVAEADLEIYEYDGSQWLGLKGTVDREAHSLSVDLAHFSRYALMGKVSLPSPTAVPSPTPPSLTATPAVTTPTLTLPPVVTSVPSATRAPSAITNTTTTLTNPTGQAAITADPAQTAASPPPVRSNWLIPLIVIGIVGLLVLVILLLTRTKK